VPAGVIVGTGTVAGYLFALHDLDYPLAEARTIAATVLLALGLYLVIALEAAGSLRRSSLVGAMCLVLAGVYALVLALPATRHFFQLSAPSTGMIATAAVASIVSGLGLALAGYLPSAAGSSAPAGE
jgi:hypothetical protein